MSWIDRHNKEVFRRKVREYVGKELSDFKRGYFCNVEDSGERWVSVYLYVIFKYRDVSIQIRLLNVREYNDYGNETVESAGQAIIDAVLDKTRVWNPDHIDCIDRDHFGLDWLSKYILDREWKEEE